MAKQARTFRCGHEMDKYQAKRWSMFPVDRRPDCPSCATAATCARIDREMAEARAARAAQAPVVVAEVAPAAHAEDADLFAAVFAYDSSDDRLATPAHVTAEREARAAADQPRIEARIADQRYREWLEAYEN